MDGNTKVLVSHAGLKGVFRDPEDEVYYFTQNKTLNDHQSFFMIPSLSRFFVLPPFVRDTMKDKDRIRISDDDKQYAKYRGIWKVCPSCGYLDHCGSVMLKNSNIGIGHCINNATYNFVVIEEDRFLETTTVYIDHTDEDDDYEDGDSQV